ncbi:hypothetical protein MRS44_010805 [Fusarium solani]|uniref:uncharacterized protein n=1 Tax=Fusarium solani TaxID=169388 RepID=UPI0032C4106F|nr:hypothetical protein MRS44_010805 [Fusarium solani]
MSMFSQFFPPKPKFIGDDIPDLTEKVFLVTGSNTGVGKEVSNILHSKNAVVYIAARNQAKAQSAIDDIRSRNANSIGALKFLQLDLSDLRSCSSATGRFLATESQLDALFNNAGVLLPPQGSKTTQRGSRNSPKGSVRVLWVSSSAAEASTPKEGVPLDNLDYHFEESAMFKYGVIPFGRIGKIKSSLQDGTKDESEGGTGTAQKFWEWQEEQVKPYL